MAILIEGNCTETKTFLPNYRDVTKTIPRCDKRTFSRTKTNTLLIHGLTLRGLLTAFPSIALHFFISTFMTIF